MATVLNKKGVSSGRMGTTSREHSRSKRRNSKELSKKTVSSLTEIMGEADPGVEENKAEDTDEEKANLSRKPRQRRARRRRRNQFGGSSLEAISEDESEDDSEGLSESEPVGTPSLDSSFPDQPTPASPSTINLENMESRPQEEAIALPQNVVELPSQADMANSYISMAVAQQNQGKLDEAMELYQKALETLLEVFGPDHAKTADAYFGIANVLKDQDKLEEAMVSFQKTLEIRLEVLGDDHIDTADTHSGIGEILCKQGKLDDALIECQKALDVQLIAAGAEDHSSTGNTFHTIAKILFHQDKLVEAMALCQHAVAIYWRTLGPGHPSTAKAKELMELAQHMMTEKCVKRKRKEILRPANQTD